MHLIFFIVLVWSKFTSTPLAPTEQLARDIGSPLGTEDSFRYHSIIHGLQYLTLTHLDISFTSKSERRLNTLDMELLPNI
jgi:hypothetical protein